MFNVMLNVLIIPTYRLLEWLFLLKALAAFLMLLYIHIIFSRTPITCLDYIKDVMYIIFIYYYYARYLFMS